MFETNRSNAAVRRIGGSLKLTDSRIPMTIRDAMMLTYGLGERYLWVDAFCIIQDDTENKHQSIQQMKQIYSSAHATIVALTGQDATSGLPGVRSGSRACQPVKWMGNTALVTHPPLLSYVQERSHWFQRAWTFQEEILSPRCFYFSEQYVYFRCNKSVWTETGGELPLDWDDTGDSDFNPLLSLRPHSEEPYGPRPWKFERYADLVGTYTQRQLSYQSDILNAFAGSLEVFQKHFDSQILCGLPVAALDLALLWFQAEPLFRRRDLNGKLISPSWSWAGWEGPVRYTIDLVRRRGRASHPTPSILEYQTYHRGTVFKAKKRLQARQDEGWYGREMTRHGISGPDLESDVLQFWAWTISWSNKPEEKSGFRVEGKIRYFDGKAFPWKGKDSGIANCLCVQWDGEISERMAVVQIQRSVWNSCAPQWKHIRLG